MRGFQPSSGLLILHETIVEDHCAARRRGDLEDCFASPDLPGRHAQFVPGINGRGKAAVQPCNPVCAAAAKPSHQRARSEEHTSELQSLMRISYAVFCLKKKKNTTQHTTHNLST